MGKFEKCCLGLVGSHIGSTVLMMALLGMDSARLKMFNWLYRASIYIYVDHLAWPLVDGALLVVAK
jgi:uncharacterized membrane protein YeaQ/YmgE (transglycosylase-associated protein family)